MVLKANFCSETELVLGELEGSTTVEVKFPCGIEEDAVSLDELTFTDTDREDRDPETLSNGPDDLKTDVGAGPWVLPPSTDCSTLLLTCSV